MDPLTLAVTTLTLIGFCITSADKVLKLIDSIRNVSIEALSLYDEISDFKVFLLEVKENATQERLIQIPGSESSATGAESHMESELLAQRGQAKLKEVEMLLQKMTKSASNNKIEVHQYVWIKKRHEIKRLRDNIKDIKTGMVLHFSSKSR
jgi:poly-D-alanine transfer protein DltD